MKRLLLFLCGVSCAFAQNASLLPENSVTKVSEHVYAIIGFPNIAFVVGNSATLVVDTGMGARNGAIVVKEARKLAKGPKLFLTTTHFHPEHSMGEQAFPPNTILIRPAVQQQELDQYRDAYIERFSNNSAANKELLKDVRMRPPDVQFEREMNLDLGGVNARLFWMGPAHTRGDEMIFVNEDSVLISGDLVQDKLVPNMPNDEASPKNWIAILDKLEPIRPKIVFPDHGALGDASLIGKEKAFLVEVQTRALELKRKGVSAEDAGKQLSVELKAKYPDWPNMGPVSNVVKRVYAEDK
jgi:glyoxylase-like metal-dependent hydrolase (beta-lactamase superfamily II)